MKFFLLITASLLFFSSRAQIPDSIQDKYLDEIVIRAFEQNKKLRDVPAAVNYIGRQTLERFGPASVLQAVNSTPGVRMEERSPGSYRFNIRGSSSRSPFGVRNIKVYYNDLPITDPGGNTYLNQLGVYNISSIEIIKGPGSSLYGAGTGGVLSIESLRFQDKPGAMADLNGGSYNQQMEFVAITTASKHSVTRAGFQHQQSDGYRLQSALKKDVHSWTGLFRFDENRILKTSFLYGNLYYQTPGALTLSEYKNNPLSSRPGAVAVGASIRQRTFLSGASYEQKLFSWLKNKSVLYGMFTELTNPNLSRYEKTSLPHLGGRTLFNIQRNFAPVQLNLDFGGEWQEGFSSLRIYKNISGNPDTLRSADEINNRVSFIFLQATADFGENWSVIAGVSLNWARLKFSTSINPGLGNVERNFNNKIVPRLALMRKFSEVSVYGSISRGFSPPATSEIIPSGGSFNRELEAEKGISYELGIKGRIFKNLILDLNIYDYHLNNTIVQRRDSSGGNYYINAGKTSQKGLELSLNYLFGKPEYKANLVWISYTYQHFRYKDFRQNNDDFSGNFLPGVAPHTLTGGLDLAWENGIFTDVHYYFSSKINLNDANSAKADEYHLLGAKLGYEKIIRHAWKIRLMAGVDNLLNEKYSLGNDINGFGGRYYNTAPSRNYYTGLLFQWMAKTQSR